MATLNASKWGFITSNNQTTHAAARGATTGTATSNPAGFSTSTAIEYAKLAGRGRGSFAYRVKRAFFYFDTSGITGTVSAASVNIVGSSAANTNVIVIPSTAFSGDGSTNLVGTDIDNVTFDTIYGAEFTGWATSGTISMTLRSTALSDIQNNNYFICAIVQFANDFSDTEPASTGQLNNGINYFTTPFLDFTVAAASNITSLNTIARANITSFDTIALANIDKINTIDN